MASIPLRAYEKKIEELIDQNHLPEAAAHCKSILRSFPKCISTYRILGKAFLEEKKFNETADVFKRVLTVYPDDFIAHVGMSIVRENENNLDAAIWHMELAFDSQPSNITIQEELKRLFGRRDGTHPTKIRLTRGALVRMYARGELYQQAIAEINSALSEDVKRIDLEVFLAKMYFLSGNQTEATNLCHRLEKEIPYGYEVNKILFESSSNADYADKNNLYAVRLTELDPYEEFISPKFPNVEDVPDDKVMVDELAEVIVEEPAKAESWVSGLDNEWEKPSFVPEPVATTSSAQPESETSPSLNSILDEKHDQFKVPLSMDQDQGINPMNTQGTKPEDWQSNIGEPQAENLNPSSPSVEGAPAEVPDWLRSLVPDAGEDKQPAPVSIPAFEGFGESEKPAVTKTEQPQAESFNFDPFTEQEPAEKAAPNSDLPDWLKNFDSEKASEPVSQDDLPDWLNSLGGANPVAQPKPAAAAFSEEPVAENPFTQPEESAKTESEAPTPVAPVPAFDLDSLKPESVNENPANIPVEETVESVQQNTETKIPEWIRMLHQNGEKETAAAPAPVKEPPVTPSYEPEVPPAFDTQSVSQTVLKEVQPAGPDQAISDQTSDELLDWLRELKPEDNQSILGDTGELHDTNLNTDSLSYDFDAELNKLNQLGASEDKPEAIQEKAASISGDDTDDFLNKLAGFQGSKETGEPPSEPETEVPATNVSEDIFSGLDKIGEAPASASTSEPTHEPEPAFEPVNTLSEANVQPEPSLPTTNAIEDLLAVTRQKPNDYLTWQKLGDEYARFGKYTDALHAYNQAEQILINLK